MGMYALAGLEADERLRSKIYDYVLKDINRRREYAKNLTQGSATCVLFQLIILNAFLLIYLYIKIANLIGLFFRSN